LPDCQIAEWDRPRSNASITQFPNPITKLPNYPITKFLLLVLSLVAASCGKVAEPRQEDLVVWRPLGTWSGAGPTQTGPFISDTGTLRLRWETRNPGSPKAAFKVTVHSDVSGRPLLVAVDHKGAGHDTTYVYEDPRPFFFVVESADLEWTLSADEPVAARGPASEKR